MIITKNASNQLIKHFQLPVAISCMNLVTCQPTQTEKKIVLFCFDYVTVMLLVKETKIAIGMIW